MEDTAHRAIAIVGVGAILPDAENVDAFWENIKSGHSSISEVPRDRWDANLYFDPDHAAPDKTYSKIGGWVRQYPWDPLKWRLAIPPKVAEAMDGGQKWAVACTRAALADYGYPERPLNTDRTAVILGNAMAGELHYRTTMRINFPEYARELSETTTFAALPDHVRTNIACELHDRMAGFFPEITEDTMPGELANCIAGRVANAFNFHGPNYVTDAACASAMAAISSAVDALIENDIDVAVTGGIDRNMGVSSFVKFCKIGALSATGTRPYAEGADGFVMGEGAVVFILKRLADAERDGDKIYAVLRGMAGASDGKGKGITAPNPVGQKLAIQRAWENAGLSPATVTLMEGHGTSTSVGDVVEVQSMMDVLGEHPLPSHSIALGSVKSNIGHLKAASGAAGMLKATLALRDKVLPPSINCQRPNPNIDFDHSPLFVNTELRPWSTPPDGVRRAGVSAFGFGGTNFHAVLEEYIPHRLETNGKKKTATVQPEAAAARTPKAPLRGALLIGAATEAALIQRLRAVHQLAQTGDAPPPAAPSQSDLRAAERLAIDYKDAADLADKAASALKAFAANQPAVWKALRPQGIYRGHGPAAKIAFLYPGQGSQYLNMLRPLADREPIVAEVFAEADRKMTPILGKPLTSYVFVDQPDQQHEDELRQTAITQPAVLAADEALTRLLAAYGIRPDMSMGHSLGEYGALVAAGALPFADALEAVAARGREMTRFSTTDNGRMAAVFAPLPEIERILAGIEGYVVIANLNSTQQAVIGGASASVEKAVEAFQSAGYNAVPLAVSHAFHTSIVAPASEPLRKVLERLRLEAPHVPIVANVDGEFYPTGPGVVPKMLDILAKQVAAPVQFIKGLETLYNAGARIFVEAGPKKALQGFAEEMLGPRGEVVSLFTNHPKLGDEAAFNQALCALYAAGHGAGVPDSVPIVETHASRPHDSAPAPVAITGAALGLPGTERIFDDGNVARILRGEQFIDVVPSRFRRSMLDKHVTRLVKSDNGNANFETIGNVSEVVKLAGRGGAFDLEAEFGVPAERVVSLDRGARLAIAAGIDALRDAGIPLVLRYKTTTKGTRLPDRWGLPDDLRDDTGVIFAAAYPAVNSLADEITRYHVDRSRREQLAGLEDLRARGVASPELDRRIDDLRAQIEKDPYTLDRRFLFRTLSMGHSQFAEFIGARGPNTQINSACASSTTAISLAEDWIRAGRCRRVVVISADDITSDTLMEWFGAGFLAGGVAATDEVVEDAAIPFDRRRHGMILGMGAAAFVVESADAVRERGLQPICEVISTVTANSAFHGTRLDVQHIARLMENLVAKAEARAGVSRKELAPRTVFVSHETYTPARGGSASAEINALRKVFGDQADRIVIANTKGFTGHAMGTGIEEVVAIKALETGCVPPVANFKEVDPELGPLNLSKGGAYPVEYALRLGAGFGSQISMTLLRWVKSADGARRTPNALGYSYRIADQPTWNAWLTRVAGQPAAELEVVRRTLRVRDGAAASFSLPVAVPKPVVVPVPAQAAVPKPAVAAAPAPAPAVDAIQEKILGIVAAKTGYPRDMLALDLDLEADLGIDTVKQAEMFAAVREAYGIARDPNLKLRDFPTLAHVIQFARDRGASAPVTAAPAPAPAVDGTQETILAIVAAKTGYPRDMLALDLDLEADLGIDTVKQAEMFAAVREAYGIARDPNLKLRDFPTLAHVIQFARDRVAPVPTVAPAAAPRVDGIARDRVAPAPAAAPPPAPAADSIQETILAIVAAKTGYPKDMLALDLDLEADLGIDTVKQAEMFAAVREAYGIGRDPNLKLRDFPTLAHVIQFARDRVTPAAAPAPAVDSIQETILAIVAEKTGYPKDMLALDLDLEADLGIDTVKQAEMFAAVRGAYGIARDPNLKLRDFPTLAHVIQFARDRGAPAAAPAPAVDAIQETILAIVAEKTGYPKDMLALDLDLEADLGIDTVKQAEMFAAVRGAFNIVRDPNLKLRDFPTLAHVIQFARDRAGTPALSTPSAPPARPAPASLEAANGIPRRVPVPVLRPALNLCKPTGVVLGPGGRVVVMPDRAGVAGALTEKLRALGVEVLGPDELSGPIAGVFWLPALDYEGDLASMDLAAWHEAVRLRVKSLFTTMRALYDQSPFLVSATLLGGHHGYDPAGAVAPMGGAVVGFTKAYKQERRDTLVKAVDFQPGRNPDEIAHLLIQETVLDPGAVEIGYRGNARWTIGLQEQPATDGQPGLTLGPDTVFVVTGAAGSIVSAITADLATASGGVFYLLDVVPEPDPANPDLVRFNSDKEGLKRDLFARIQARGDRATPALVEKELAALERAVAARNAIDAVTAAGGTAHYLSVNLTDAAGVAQAIGEVRARSGRIDVLLHAAGVERSHFLPDKDPREFDLVFDVKCDGWFHLLHAIGDMPLGATVVFSSIAGRFGNGGQTDYSSANDLLCKITSSFRTTRPNTRAIAIDWTAWGGIGMATRGSIPKMMELAGIDMLPPEAGVPLIRRELTAGAAQGEIVVAQRLGIMMNEWDAAGGLNVEALPAAPMFAKATGMTVHQGLTVETTLDPKVQPFLYDHQIDGTPVLPGVMGVEAFAEAAHSMLPDWHVAAVEDVHFLAPFKFYRHEPRTVTVHAMFYSHGEDVVAECRLTGSRPLPNQPEPQITTHFTARVRLSKQLPETAPAPPIGELTGAVIEAENIYQVYFHGPAYQVVERAWLNGASVVGRMAGNLPANHHPPELPVLMAPRLMELCLQTSGIWEIARESSMGLPLQIGEVSLCRPPEEAIAPLYAVVTPHPDQGSFDAQVMDSAGTCYLRMTGYRTVALGSVNPELLKAVEHAMA